MDDLAFLRWRLGGIAALVVIAALIYFVSKQAQYVPSPAEVEAARAKVQASTTTAPSTSTTVPELVVDVAGAVTSPGLYSLGTSARVADAVEAAGGFTESADRERINLAERISDGQRIYVLKIGQSPPDFAGQSLASVSNNPPSGGTGGSVNINTASAEQLDALPGVGPATAQAIITYRNEHGPFASVDSLASVKGIGPAKLTQLKSLARV